MNLFVKISGIFLFTLHLFCAAHCRAQEQQVNETAAKVAFVFNAALYISWPLPINEYILIGVLGKGPLDREWKNVNGKTQQGRKLKIFKSDDVEEMQECQIVYIEETSPKKISRILSRLRNYPVFTIGDSPAFISSAGMLNVYVVNNRISFSANLAEARAAGMDISSKLLRLATEVIK